MSNAKKEILEHIGDREVDLIRIVYGCKYDDESRIIEGGLDAVLPQLDFEYDNSYGSQQLFGYIWYKDGTWSDRGEYDGSEWWQHQYRPKLDIDIEN